MKKGTNKMTMEKGMKTVVVALAVVACAGTAGMLAGCSTLPGNEAKTVRKIVIDPDAKPIRNLADSSCFPVLGYAGSLCGDGEDANRFFVEDRENTARAFRQAGARFVRQWSAVRQWQTGAGCSLQTDKKTNAVKVSHPEFRTDMKNVFQFYKDYGIKVILTLENYGVITNLEKNVHSSDIKDVKRVICDYVKWIVDNGFQECVGGLELGNEPYWMGGSMDKEGALTPETYAARWCEIIPEIKKIWPKAELGIPLAEYFQADPDIAAVRNRTLGAESLAAKGYFDASNLNRWSARFVMAMSNQLHNVGHVIYHSYGADAPFSATYWGIMRYRRFTDAFPELKGKKFWITEWRDRSDEDVPSSQRYRETLNKSAFMLMMTAQADVDCMNLHEFRCQTGSVMWSWPDNKNKTGNWVVQWMHHGPDRADYDSIGKARIVIGSMGPAMQNIVESLRRYPVVLDYGSDNHGSYSEGCSNAVWSCSDYYGSVLDYRLALKQGKTKDEMPEINGDCEYLITMSPGKNLVAFHAVNMNNEPVEFDLEFPEMWLAHCPDYRVVECPEEFLDAHEIPGYRFTKEYAYQPYAMPVGTYRIKIPANSVTTLTIPVGKTWKGNRAREYIIDALTLAEVPAPRVKCGKDQSPDDYRYLDALSHGAKFTVIEKGRKTCDWTIGKFRDEKSVVAEVFKDEVNKIEISFACDLDDTAARDMLKEKLFKLYRR